MEIEEPYIYLTILIASIPERSEQLTRLDNELNRQLHKLGDDQWKITININGLKSFLNGGMSIGEKRNSLLKSANSKYICFLDDDETIAPNYIETLLQLCKENKDVCTFRSLYKLEDYWGVVNMSLKHHLNEQATPEYTVRRKPWHICPVKREFAQLYEFEDKNNAEDYEWMEKVLTHCTTEAHTDKIIFQYNHGKHSEADKIENYGK